MEQGSLKHTEAGETYTRRASFASCYINENRICQRQQSLRCLLDSKYGFDSVNDFVGFIPLDELIKQETACPQSHAVPAKHYKTVLRHPPILAGDCHSVYAGLLEAVLLVEFVHAAAGVDELLLAGVERVALGADLDGDVLLRGAGLVHGAAGAADRGRLVIRMDTVFHSHSPHNRLS